MYSPIINLTQPSPSQGEGLFMSIYNSEIDSYLGDIPTRPSPYEGEDRRGQKPKPKLLGSFQLIFFYKAETIPLFFSSCS